jgi:two-component sensor histidine kinase
MVQGLRLFIGLFNNLALLIVFVALYGYLNDRLRKARPLVRQALLGLLFASFVLGFMQVKIPVSEGVVVDQRNAIVIMAGAFGGPITAAMTALAGGAYRVALGGRGVLGGLLGLGLSFIAGCVLRSLRPKIDRPWSFALAALASALFVLPGFLPIGDFRAGWELMKAMALPYCGAITVGIAIGSLLLANEERRHEDQARLKASLAEKEALLGELYHRANNNMQVISSFLTLQAEALCDEKVEALAQSASTQIRAMSLVYEKLHESGNLSRIDARDYFRELIPGFEADEIAGRGRIRIELDIDDIELLVDEAVPLGLIVNELTGNAFKHAFPGGRNGRVRVALKERGQGALLLEIADDGVGLPPGFDPLATTSFGLSTTMGIIKLQLKGKVEVSRGVGLAYRMELTRERYGERV